MVSGYWVYVTGTSNDYGSLQVRRTRSDMKENADQPLGWVKTWNPTSPPFAANDVTTSVGEPRHPGVDLQPCPVICSVRNRVQVPDTPWDCHRCRPSQTPSLAPPLAVPLGSPTGQSHGVFGSCSSGNKAIDHLKIKIEPSGKSWFC